MQPALPDVAVLTFLEIGDDEQIFPLLHGEGLDEFREGFSIELSFDFILRQGLGDL